MKIGGWGYIKPKEGLTREETKFVGHRIWGGLEPMLSLKTWFAGGECRVDPTWRTGHLFGRDSHVQKSRGSRLDMYYFNKLFMAYTLFEPEQAKILDNHLLKERNPNLARTYLKRNSKAIKLEKKWNDKIRVQGIEVFEDIFGYDLDMFK